MLGRGLLGLAIAFSVYAGVTAPLSQRLRRPELLESARRALIGAFFAVAGAAGLMWYALFTRDFSFEYVAQSTSRSAAPWYTFSAFWSGMAGSLLLWALVLSTYAAVFAWRRNPQ